MAGTNHPTFYSTDGLLTETYDARAALHIAASPVEGDVESIWISRNASLGLSSTLDAAPVGWPWRSPKPVMRSSASTAQRPCFDWLRSGATACRRSPALASSSTELLELRWTYRSELRHLLELCGFAVRAEHGDFRGSAPAYGQEQVWVVERSS